MYSVLFAAANANPMAVSVQNHAYSYSGTPYTRTEAISVSVSGGNAPLTYSWVISNSSAYAVSIISGQGSDTITVSITASSFPGGVQGFSADCTVTDSTGQGGYSSGSQTIQWSP